jgi:hypothetical protein
MCDISFFITLQRVQDENGGNSPAQVMSPEMTIERLQLGDSPGLLVIKHDEARRTAVYEYMVKVVDCDNKPASKLGVRAKKEEVIRLFQPET